MATSAVLKFLLSVGKGAEYVGAADAVLTVAELGLARAGVIQPGTKLLVEGANIIMDAAGVPRRNAKTPQLAGGPSPSSPNAAPPLPRAATSSSAGATASSPAAAPPPPIEAAPPERRLVCPACASGRVILAGAGEEIALVLCGDHEQKQQATLAGVESLYIGYAKAWGVDLAGCGGKPNPNNFKNFWGNVEQVDYLTALTNWQQCIANDKAAKAKTAAQIDAAKKAQAAADKSAADTAAAAAAQRASADKQRQREVDRRVAQQSLEWQRKRYEGQIAALQQRAAKEKSDTERAALQKQIDDLSQQKADAEKVANEISQQARDAQHQAELDRMRAEIAASAQKPGGLDEMFKMALMAKMLSPSGGGVDPAMLAMMQQQAAAGGGGEEGGGELDFAGQGDENAIEDDLAQAMGLAGAHTTSEAETLFNLRANFPDEDTSSLFDGMAGDEALPTDGCSLGSCSL